MRVVLVGTEIPDHCVQFADTVADTCDVLLLIPDRYYTPERARQKPQLQIEWLPWPRKRDPRNIAFLWNVVKRIRAWTPDVVHFANETNVWNWLLVRFLKGVPVVTTVHDLKFHPGDVQSRRIPRIFANALIKKSNAIIVHGKTIYDDAVRLLPVRPDQVHVLPLVPPLLPPDHSSSCSSTKIVDGTFRILFFGRIYEYKGLRYLLEAMPHVRQRLPNSRLIVAGEGDDISKYQDYITDRSYLEIINRFISRDEIAQLFLEADLLVLPYIEASQSGPLMIAMAFGLPVVTTAVGEMPNVVLSADIGIVVPPQDKLALADAICKIALDRQLRNRFSSNAKLAIHEGEFSRKTISERVKKIYQVLINQH